MDFAGYPENLKSSAEAGNPEKPHVPLVSGWDGSLAADMDIPPSLVVKPGEFPTVIEPFLEDGAPADDMDMPASLAFSPSKHVTVIDASKGSLFSCEDCCLAPDMDMPRSLVDLQELASVMESPDHSPPSFADGVFEESVEVPSGQEVNDMKLDLLRSSDDCSLAPDVDMPRSFGLRAAEFENSAVHQQDLQSHFEDGTLAQDMNMPGSLAVTLAEPVVASQNCTLFGDEDESLPQDVHMPQDLGVTVSDPVNAAASPEDPLTASWDGSVAADMDMPRSLGGSLAEHASIVKPRVNLQSAFDDGAFAERVDPLGSPDVLPLKSAPWTDSPLSCEDCISPHIPHILEIFSGECANASRSPKNVLSVVKGRSLPSCHVAATDGCRVSTKLQHVEDLQSLFRDSMLKAPLGVGLRNGARSLAACPRSESVPADVSEAKPTAKNVTAGKLTSRAQVNGNTNPGSIHLGSQLLPPRRSPSPASAFEARLATPTIPGSRFRAKFRASSTGTTAISLDLDSGAAPGTLHNNLSSIGTSHDKALNKMYHPTVAARTSPSVPQSKTGFLPAIFASKPGGLDVAKKQGKHNDIEATIWSRHAARKEISVNRFP